MNKHSKLTHAFVWFLGIGSLFLATAVRAEPAPAPGQAPSPAPKVTEVKGLIKLHETLTVKCEGLKEWAQTKTNDPSKLVLYLNGTQMKGIMPKSDRVGANELFFTLERVVDSDEKKDNRKAWDALLSRPKSLGKDGAIRVTIGPESGLPFESNETASLYAIDKAWFIVYVVLLICLATGMVMLGKKSNLLRDSGPDPANGKKKCYSLARAQMACWFFLIVSAYVFIWMVTSATDTISASVLGLMGISAGTGLAAVVVDNSKRAQATTELEKLKTEKAKLEGQKTALVAAFPTESAQRLADLPGLIEPQQKLVDPCPSQQFLHDILSDSDGISFHRLQIAVWTVVLGFIFCVSVWNVLSMPTFSDTLLGLMGISGGTYVGFKIPEK
jgi:hypothetical protein